MVENFDPAYDGFFEEPSYEKRWKRLLALYTRSHATFRILFVVETLAMVHTWVEPTPDLLQRFWRHKKSGGVLGVSWERLAPLILSLWTLDAAKAEVQLYQIALKSDFASKYPLGTMRRYSSALIHAWWAVETALNEFADIVLEEREGSVSGETVAILREVRPQLNGKGQVIERPYRQGVLERIQFIVSFLTGRSPNRNSMEWRRLVELKNSRDSYVHRIGRPSAQQDTFAEESTVLEGMKAVRALVARLLRETPEFGTRFAYKYLEFWCCGTEAPFIWDGKEGPVFLPWIG